jgi:protein-tyrosine phosphatase
MMSKVTREGRPGALYLGAMPGQSQPFQAFLNELESRQIGTVVSLTALDEIRQKSPGYAIRVANGTVPVHSFRHLPVPDYSAPQSEGERREYLEAVRRTRDDLAAGRNVFVHCGAGVGRTGTFAITLLLLEGASMAHALQAVGALGSRPETESQRELLWWIAREAT